MEDFVVYNVFNPDSSKAKKPANKFNIYSHFVKFIEFYKEEGTYFAELKAISLDQSEKALEAGKIYTIKDPFDSPHNPGRADNDSRSDIFRALDNAHAILKSKLIKSTRTNRGIEDLFTFRDSR